MARRILSVLGAVSLLVGCSSGGSNSSAGGNGGAAGAGLGGQAASGGGAGTTGSGGSAGAGGEAAAAGGTSGMSTAIGGAAGTSPAAGGASGTATGGAAAGGVGGGASGGATAGTGGTAPAGAGGAGGGAAMKLGLIVATQTIVGSATTSSAVATFTQMTEMNPCVPTTSGNCRLYACPTVTPTQKTYFQAGGVAITGLSMPLTLTYAAGPQMYTDNLTGALWTAAATATASVTASSGVPAATLNLTAPSLITATAPAAPYTISKSADLPVTWSGGAEGTVTVSLSSGSGTSLVSIDCDAAATAGTLTVPAAMLAHLGASGGFSIAVATDTTQAVNDWQMKFEASSVAVQATAMYTN